MQGVKDLFGDPLQKELSAQITKFAEAENMSFQALKTETKNFSKSHSLGEHF